MSKSKRARSIKPRSASNIRSKATTRPRNMRNRFTIDLDVAVETQNADIALEHAQDKLVRAFEDAAPRPQSLPLQLPAANRRGRDRCRGRGPLRRARRVFLPQAALHAILLPGDPGLPRYPALVQALEHNPRAAIKLRAVRVMPRRQWGDRRGRCEWAPDAIRGRRHLYCARRGRRLLEVPFG
jgi:hypothetical protein